MNMDEIPKNVYSDSNPFASDPTTTFTVTTVAVVNSVAVASDGGGVRDVVPSKTVDKSLEIQGKNSEAVVELFKSRVIHQIFPPEEFSPEIEMVARGLEKHLKLDQREFLMNSFPPVCTDETRRSKVVAFGLQRPKDNDRYVKNYRNARSPQETRHILHRYANEDVSLGSLFIGLDVEHIDE
ncbi:Beta-1,3-galactosyltransferase 7 [Capsicum chinense]|nr:Beta-1,3-galactosyltransferase 7 [Capsicum chinense]